METWPAAASEPEGEPEGAAVQQVLQPSDEQMQSIGDCVKRLLANLGEAQEPGDRLQTVQELNGLLTAGPPRLPLPPRLLRLLPRRPCCRRHRCC